MRMRYGRRSWLNWSYARVARSKLALTLLAYSPRESNTAMRSSRQMCRRDRRPARQRARVSPPDMVPREIRATGKRLLNYSRDAVQGSCQRLLVSIR